MDLQNNVAIGVHPKLILVFSGKRKSGKDFIAETLIERFESLFCLIRLSAPLKKQFAQDHDLNFDQLLDSTNYKEMFRVKMIEWGEMKRNEDPSYFCKLALTQNNTSQKPIWIISDARRETDLIYFKTTFPNVTKTIRVNATQEARESRGWIYTRGVDDVTSECGLDHINVWDYQVTNNGLKSELDLSMKPIIDMILSTLNEDC